MRALRRLAVILVSCAAGLALVVGSVILVLLALDFLQRALAPPAFIALSSLVLSAFCLHMVLSPDGWLFRRDEGRRLGPKGWVNLAAQLFAGGVVILSAGRTLNAVLVHYPEKFWLVAAAAGILIFGAAACADRRRRRGR